MINHFLEIYTECSDITTQSQQNDNPRSQYMRCVQKNHTSNESFSKKCERKIRLHLDHIV